MIEDNDSGLDHIEAIETSDEGLTARSRDGYFVPLFTKNLELNEWKKFITNIKALVRSSPEYSAFIAHCKTDLGLVNCSFLSGVNDDADKVNIEMHHSPFTIHEIIEIIVEHMLEKGPVTTMMICQEVMKAHFHGMVAVVPLSETVHQLVHAGKINVDVRQTYGDTLEFVKHYHKGVQKEHLMKLKAILDVSKRKFLHDENLFDTDPDKWLGNVLEGQETLKFIDHKLEGKSEDI